MFLKPTAAQCAYNDLELGIFFHFGIRTFNEEHRDWDMKPMELSSFNPTALDCESWMRDVVRMGGKYTVLTTKHHDGFCLWRTKYSDFAVQNTPFRNGEGDVIREYCDACRKYGITRYHQVSTDEVYGDLPLDRPDLFFTEETPIHTSSPYSSSKAGADLLVLAYHRTFGLPVTISRCSNNYGPYHFPEKLIPLMIANALNDKPLPVYGEGLNVRDWLYVEDHCKAIDLIIHKGRVGEVYNIGGHNEMKNIDIVKIICKALGKPESLITYVTDRKGHDMRYAIDPTKIHNELGWLPETMFADGIQKTIQWYLDNKEWWETIISGEYQNYYDKMYGNR